MRPLLYMHDHMQILDVGCGLGYAVAQYAQRFDLTADGIDYSSNMIAGANELLKKTFPDAVLRVCFQHASVTELPFEDDRFDVVTSHRCLMALLDWEIRESAGARSIACSSQVACSSSWRARSRASIDFNGGAFEVRADPSPPDGRDRLSRSSSTRTRSLISRPHYAFRGPHRFGMYYFLTRVRAAAAGGSGTAELRPQAQCGCPGTGAVSSPIRTAWATW